MATKLALKNPLHDIPDQIIFFIAAVAGIASIVAMKVGNVTQFVVTLIPVGFILAYAALVWLNGRARIREDRIGDNCYYLGFVYTLTSLACALYAYDVTGAGIETIIHNFGIALGTTLVGIVLRVFFHQMRSDPHEVELEVRQSLGEAARSLRTELNSITESMEDFRRRIVQIVEEGVNDVQEKSRATLDANVSAFNTATIEVIKTVDTTLKSYEETSQRMGKVSELVVNAIEHLAKRVEGVNVSPELVSAKLDPVIEKLGAVVEQVSAREAGHTKSLQALKKNLDASVKSAENLSTSLESAAAGTGPNLARLLDGAHKAVAGAEDGAAAAKKILAETAAAAAEFRGATKALSVQVAEDTRNLTQMTQEFSAEIRRQRESVIVHGREMKELAAESAKAFEEVQQNLVSLSRAIVDHVRA
jgi:hypothetical protein